MGTDEVVRHLQPEVVPRNMVAEVEFAARRDWDDPTAEVEVDFEFTGPDGDPHLVPARCTPTGTSQLIPATIRFATRSGCWMRLLNKTALLGSCRGHTAGGGYRKRRWQTQPTTIPTKCCCLARRVRARYSILTFGTAGRPITRMGRAALCTALSSAGSINSKPCSGST